MSVTDHRRVLADLAVRIRCGVTLQDEERTYLANCIQQISEGADANEAFGVKRGRGQSVEDDRRREKLSIAMHLVSALVEESNNVEAACKKIADLISEKGGWSSYDAAYLRQCWYNYPHMRSIDRTLFDEDFPYGL